MRTIFSFAALLFIAGCGGDDSLAWPRRQQAGSRSKLVEYRSENQGVAGDKSGGPPRGWWVGSGPEFFIDSPTQSVEHPAKLIFTMQSDFFDDLTRGRVDQLGVFLPGGFVSGREVVAVSRKRPCGARPLHRLCRFLENGDGRIVVLVSEPSTG